MEETPPMETAAKMPRLKNPNSVKAGLASAESRRRKDAEFFDVKQRLALLEEQKKHELPQEVPQKQSSTEEVFSAEPSQAAVTKEPPHSTLNQWSVDWSPWIHGGLGLAVVGYVYNITRKAKPLWGNPPALKVKSAAAKPAPKPAAPQAADPFYME